ncbi:MAG: Fe-S protein assembly chaperone HscA, partial [Betaproteobacteria bacterium]|nr:Fe-S protein assembly chaperone HscA [Betaproteobacteria bacterium]
SAASDVYKRQVVKPSYGLGDEEITRMLREAIDHASDDIQRRALTEQKVDAERLLLSVQAALDADAALLQPDEQAAIHAAMANLRSVAEKHDHHAIRDAMTALGHQTDHFAALRMDHAVSMAFRGLKLDDLAS